MLCDGDVTASAATTSSSRSSAGWRSSARSTRDHPELTLCDVARRPGLTRAAARRFLLTLADLGYVRTDGAVLAHPAGAGARLRVPVQPDAARGRRAAPRAARRARCTSPRRCRCSTATTSSTSARVPTRGSCRVDQRRHALPRLRDVDGPRAAGRRCRRRARAYLDRDRRWRRSPPATVRPRDAAGRAGPRSARRAGRSSTRSWRRDCGRSPRRSATASGRVVARDERLGPRQPRPLWTRCGGRCCRRCWPRPPASRPT